MALSDDRGAAACREAGISRPDSNQMPLRVQFGKMSSEGDFQKLQHSNFKIVGLPALFDRQHSDMVAVTLIGCEVPSYLLIFVWRTKP